MSSACPELSELEQYVVGALPSGPSTQIDRHTSGCSACRERLADVRENLNLLQPMQRILKRADNRDSSLRTIPESIGHYKIIREIGRGGMGIVYEGIQPHPHRAVAIKVLHAGSGHDQRSERMFQREAEALGRLKHASIAAIFDAGMADNGRPYLVMEIVEGKPLRQFSHRRVRERVELFIKICEALAYAHQRGVIHRDLKPSNIFVIESGSGSTPKVLDFGLAKFVDSGVSEGRSIVTEVGQIHGTLPYMSPEQVRGDARDIDIRSDVYSLGVILYELLAGKLPYSLDRASIPHAANIICEAAPASLRGLNPEIAPDLETIVEKALEKDPDQRYSSAAALAEDLNRFLLDQPILARPATLVYQVRKLVRRHRVLSAVILAMFVMGTSLGIAMSILYARANRESHRAQLAEQRAQREAKRAHEEAETANSVRDYLIKVFQVSDPDQAKGRSVTALELLDAGARRIESFAREPAVKASLMETIGLVYQNLGLIESALPLLEGALAIWEKRPDEFATRISSICTALGQLQLNERNLASAEKYFRRSLELVKARLAPSDWHIAEMMNTLADVMTQRGDLKGAEALLRESLTILRESPHKEFTIPKCVNSLACVLDAQDRPEEGIPFLLEGLDTLKEDGKSTSRASLQNNLAWLYKRAGRLEEAESIAGDALRIRKELLLPGHPSIGSSLTVLGSIHLRQGKYTEAEKELRESARIHQAAGSPPTNRAEALALLGECLLRTQRLEEAETALLESEKLAVNDARSLHDSRALLIQLYEEWKKPEKAAAVRRSTEGPATQPARS